MIRRGSDETGVSITTGFIINLGVATIAIGFMLFISQGTLTDVVDTTEENQLRVTGEQIVSDLERADRLARSGGEGTIDMEQPDVSYNVRITEDTGNDNYLVNISSSRVLVSLQYTGEADVEDTPVEFSSRQNVRVSYEEDEIEIE